VCRFHAFQDDLAVTGGEELAIVEVSLRRNRSLTASLLASSARSLGRNPRLYCGIISLNIFMVSIFSAVKV